MQTMQSTPVETLFFIPDISGFTKFVTETEICHSQHIVKELLEALVDANTLELKVAEFEGDAVLFYRHGPPPPLEAIVEQARRMFVEFHGLLQRIEYLRVCRCGACTGASRLGLKVVAHHGAASTMAVKDHVKFIGRDVIVAHRLLKNSVPEAEYLLLTQATLARLGLADADTGTGFAPGADAYDDLGKISYRYRSLAGYLADVRFDPPPPSGLKDPVKMMRISRRIDASAERIYELLIDLPARMQWIDGIKSIEFRDDRPNQIGKVHRCVREGNDPEVVTSDARIGEQALEFWETDTKRLGACKYSLTKAADGATDVVLEFFVRRNLIVQLVFKALMQRKLKAGFERSLANLARLCTAG
ncbi:MAG: DUF2652 domain-containing protein [Caldimonas sp.]